MHHPPQGYEQAAAAVICANDDICCCCCWLCAGKLPLMEIVFLLEREEREETLLKSIVFNSVYGMPIKGEQAALLACCRTAMP